MGLEIWINLQEVLAMAKFWAEFRVDNKPRKICEDGNLEEYFHTSYFETIIADTLEEAEQKAKQTEWDSDEGSQKLKSIHEIK